MGCEGVAGGGGGCGLLGKNPFSPYPTNRYVSLWRFLSLLFGGCSCDGDGFVVSAGVKRVAHFGSLASGLFLVCQLWILGFREGSLLGRGWSVVGWRLQQFASLFSVVCTYFTEP